MMDDTGPSAAESPALPPGSKVDRYEIVSLLTHGPQAISYGARDLQLGRDVVIKEYFPADLATRQGTMVGPRSPDAAAAFTEGLARFGADGHALENRPGGSEVERVLALFEANGTTYVVSERVNAETLVRRSRTVADAPASPQPAASAETSRLRPWRVLALGMAAIAIALVIGFLMLASPFGPAEGRYGGRYVGVVQVGTGFVAKLDLSIAGTTGKGSADSPTCGVHPLSVEVSPQGLVTGRLPEPPATCGVVTYNFMGEVKGEGIDLAVTCDTCTGSAKVILSKVATVPQTYDGNWSVVHVCPPVGTAEGFTNRYTMSVKDGYAVARWRPPGEPNSFTFAGQIRADGTVTFQGYGRLPAARYLLAGQRDGMPFAFSATGQFDGRDGKATTDIRDCTLAFAMMGS